MTLASQSLAEYRLTILVVEDDENCLASLVSFLLLDGHSAYTAGGGLEAVDFARRWRVAKQRLDLTMLDCNMPDLSGIETYKRLARELPGTKAIFMSGDSSASLESEVLNVGGFALVRKPLNLSRVRGLLAHFQPAHFQP